MRTVAASAREGCCQKITRGDIIYRRSRDLFAEVAIAGHSANL